MCELEREEEGVKLVSSTICKEFDKHLRLLTMKSYNDNNNIMTKRFNITVCQCPSDRQHGIYLAVQLNSHGIKQKKKHKKKEVNIWSTCKKKNFDRPNLFPYFDRVLRMMPELSSTYMRGCCCTISGNSI